MKKLIVSISLIFFCATLAWGAGTIYKSWGTNTEILSSYTFGANERTEKYSSVVDMVTNGYEGSLVSVYLEEGSAAGGAGVSVWFVHEDLDDLSGVTYMSPNISFETAEADSGITKTFMVTDCPYFFVGISQTDNDTYTVIVDSYPWRWQYN